MRLMSKRIFDFTVAAVMLMLLSPLLLLIALLVRINLGAPVLFRQMRPGLNEVPFRIVKFRTMTSACDADGNLLPDTQRLTAFGRFLRRTSFDELPELLNVLRGDMSLVGPRPLLMRYLPYFTERERLRFTVRPGITGLAQISGRNELPWDIRLRKDVEYASKHSFLLDLRIVIATIIRVLRSSGVQEDPRSVLPDLDEERICAGHNSTR